jgi:adenosylmethionine-8-amino-7-oxononanoate aminotransferase
VRGSAQIARARGQGHALQALLLGHVEQLELDPVGASLGVLHAADETICGYGRLGEWFGAQRYDYEPDIITCAKGLTSGYVPLGGFAVSDRFMAEISGAASGGNNFSNGYTWSGNPVSCAAALASWRPRPAPERAAGAPHTPA